MTMTRQSTSRSALATLAQDLTAGLHEDGSHRHARLPQGLEIVMQRCPDACRRRSWRLALAREQVFPSTDEVDACCIAFRVPASASERRLERCHTHPKSGRRIRYHVVELTWQEQDPEA